MEEKKNITNFPKRKSIPPSVRFEVFKRDAFTCQYCGQKAPDVILHVDHIKPVADGGENEIVNLITSCLTCNSGKGARALDDNTVIAKQRLQLEELNERRNQLEMLLKWREGLRDLEGDYLQAVQNEFLSYGPFTANETAEKEIRRWLKKYSLNEIIAAIGKSFPQYFKDDKDGKPDGNSWSKAFDMVPRIMAVDRRGGMPPEKMKLFYIRGILRRRLNYVDERNVISLMEQAIERGADIDRIQNLAKDVRNWTAFNECLQEFISQNSGDKNGED